MQVARPATQKLPHDDMVHIRLKETADSFFRRTYNRFSFDIERCIEKHSDIGQFFELIKQIPIALIGLLGYGLYAR